MVLCFGTFARILKLCCPQSISNKRLVDRLVKTIDPDSKYGSGNDSAVSKLMHCTSNFPTVQVTKNKEPSVLLVAP